VPDCFSRALGHLKIISGQGMPSQRHHELGDLYVRINVRFPDALSPEAIPFLERALPPRDPIKPTPKAALVEDVELLDLDARQQKEQARRAVSGDEMDEDEAPRVQCANQ
jgi:DnaJ family protein A protein 2